MENIMFIALVAIIGVVAYLALISLSDMQLQKGKNVDRNSIMATKYAYLIEQFTKSTNTKILVMTNDHVYIRSVDSPTATNIYLTDKGNTLEIKWIAQMGRMGTHEQQWAFNANTPQEKIIEQISDFLEQKTKQLTGNIL